MGGHITIHSSTKHTKGCSRWVCYRSEIFHWDIDGNHMVGVVEMAEK